MEKEFYGTSFSEVYDCFLGKITDDMWEISEDGKLDVIQLAYLRNLLISAIPNFEFPRKSLQFTINTNSPEQLKNNIYNEQYYFNTTLTFEEINILAILMMNEWLQQQVTSIENIRMKYSGSDFKFTSQANHLGKLLSLQSECQRQSNHMQRLYKRRKIDSNGNISSNWSIFKTTNDRID